MNAYKGAFARAHVRRAVAMRSGTMHSHTHVPNRIAAAATTTPAEEPMEWTRTRKPHAAAPLQRRCVMCISSVFAHIHSVLFHTKSSEGEDWLEAWSKGI